MGGQQGIYLIGSLVILFLIFKFLRKDDKNKFR